MQEFAAVLATVILIGLSVFQLLLALGKPYGEFAWGGQHRRLPKNLRYGSLATIAVYLWFTSIILDKAGMIGLYPPGFIADSGIWVVAVFLGISLIPNIISRSRKERFTMTPIVLTLLILTVVTAVNTFGCEIC